ncbi:histidine phosphatase family protein [Streptomyces sp. NPDC094034]|uniref:histidine phosphatase family protein n=1 Tax=Streptomyces sp. NPDC094034 TaxID=3155309 RepID=UPI00331C7B79
MRLILVRHGRTRANAQARFPLSSAVPLDETGREQVTRTGQRIAASDFRPEIIHSSDAERALQTAALLRDSIAPGLRIAPRPDLRELDWGELRGRSTSTGPAGEAAYARWQRGPMDPLPGGEGLADVAARVARVLRLITDDGRPAIVVSHAVTLTVLTAQANGWDLAETWRSHRAHLSPGQFHLLDLSAPQGAAGPLPHRPRTT